MSKKSIILVAIGITFVLVSMFWFLTPLSEFIVQSVIRGSGLSTVEKIPGQANDQGFWEALRPALDGLNAFIGVVGLYLTSKGVQSNIGFQSKSSP